MSRIVGILAILVLGLVLGPRPASTEYANNVRGGGNCPNYKIPGVCPDTPFSTNCQSISADDKGWWCWYTLNFDPVLTDNCEDHVPFGTTIPCGDQDRYSHNPGCTIVIACWVG